MPDLVRIAIEVRCLAAASPPRRAQAKATSAAQGAMYVLMQAFCRNGAASVEIVSNPLAARL